MKTMFLYSTELKDVLFSRILLKCDGVDVSKRKDESKS